MTKHDFDVSKESKDFEAWHAVNGQTADYINGSDKHRAWMAWLARAIAAGVKTPLEGRDG